MRFKGIRLAVALSLVTGMTACGGGGTEVVPVPVGGTSNLDFTLQLLHGADMEGNGESVADAPRFSAVLAALRAERPHETLILSSGDNYIPGSFFDAGDDPSLDPLVGKTDKGRPDIAMLNAMGIQASTIGNHEFDQGPEAFASLIAPDEAYPGALFPYLSANVNVENDADLGPLATPDGQLASSIPNAIAGSAVVIVNGKAIGLVGMSTPTLETISSTGPEVQVLPANDDLSGLAAIVQDRVDHLTSLGIEIVILMAHMQVLSFEEQIAPLLRDVDIILGGGSDAILADSNDRLRPGDSAYGTYPLWTQSSTGQPIAIVNTDGQYRYVGRLVVGFDDEGVILEDTVDEDVSGAYATDDQGVADLGNPSPNPQVAAIAQAVGAVLASREGNTFGKTDVFLNGIRGSVRTEETNLGNLSADANLAYAQSVDASTCVSIKNGGGIRKEIGFLYWPPGATDPDDVEYLPPAAIPVAGKEEGEISQLDVQNALAFNNGLTLVTVTAAELKALLEHGVGAWPSVSGRFCQLGGVRVSFDGNAAAGSRIRNLVVLDPNGANPGATPDVIVQNGALVGDVNRTFRVVTLGFLAGGGDGYPFPATDVVDLVLAGDFDGAATFAETGSEQDALAEYLVARHPAVTPYAQADTEAKDDRRIQNLAVPGTVDTVLANP